MEEVEEVSFHVEFSNDFSDLLLQDAAEVVIEEAEEVETIIRQVPILMEWADSRDGDSAFAPSFSISRDVSFRLTIRDTHFVLFLLPMLETFAYHPSKLLET